MERKSSSSASALGTLALVCAGSVVITLCVLGFTAAGSIWLKAAQLTGRHHLPAAEEVVIMLLGFGILLWLGRAITGSARDEA